MAEIYNDAVLHGVATFDVEPQPPELFRERVASTRPGDHVVVAVEGCRVLGMAYAATYRPRPAYDGTRETSVYVAAEARGRGLGRALYDELLGRVDADGIHVCLAVIALPNPASEAAPRGGGVRARRHPARGGPQVRPLGRHGVVAAAAARAGRALGPGLGWVAMGATGSGPFENDDALDFLDGLADLAPEARSGRVLEALDAVLVATGYVEAPDMCEAVAGAAAVGASVNPGAAAGEPYLPPWLGSQPLPVDDEELVEKSRQVLRRAVRAHDNEWWELWDEAGLADDVRASCRRALAWLGDRDD